MRFHLLVRLVALFAVAAPGDLDLTFGGGDGLVDTDFSGGGDSVRALAIQPDGKLVAAGTSNVTAFVSLARYTSSGVLDTTFGGGDGTVHSSPILGQGQADALAIQPDGKLVVAGSIPFNGGFTLARYTPVGTLDTAFGGGDGVVQTAFAVAPGSVQGFGYAVVLQPDGKIVLAGQDGDDQNFALARYTSDGTPDTTFGGGDGTVETDFTGLEDEAYALVLQRDGKLVAAGLSYVQGGPETDGTQFAHFGLARYTTAGELDTSFGGGDGKVQTRLGPGVGATGLVLQPNGRLVASGGVSDGMFHLARYTPAGALDSSFGGGDGKVSTTVGASAEASDLVLQPDGKLVMAGTARAEITGDNMDFTLVRFTPAGLVDTTFGGGDGHAEADFDGGDDGAWAVALQPDGKLVAAGAAAFGRDFNFGLARFQGQAPTATTIVSSSDPPVIGQSVRFTATVAPVPLIPGTPGGTVQFTIDGAPFGAPVTLVGGSATSISATAVALGSHTVRAIFSGDAIFNASTGALTQTVVKVSTTTSLTSSSNPVRVGDPVTFTAAVSRMPQGPTTPAGTVQFRKATTNLGAPVALAASGRATFTTTSSALGVGTQPIRAVYSGAATFSPSASPVLDQRVCGPGPCS